MELINNLVDEMKEKEALKNHIKEHALHGKCLVLRPQDAKRLDDMLSDYRDGMKYELNVESEEVKK